MARDMLQSEQIREKKRISFACVLVSIVFYSVYSQFLIMNIPEMITMMFRPILSVFVLFKMRVEGSIHSSARTMTFVSMVYCLFSLLYTQISLSSLKIAGSIVLFLLMFYVVTGAKWNQREISFIIFVTFVACFSCVVVFFISNDPFDFSAAIEGRIQFLGVEVNRNQNTYAFSVGALLGISYLRYGRNIPKIVVFVMTALLLYGVLYSQSRGAFICLVAGIICLECHEIKNTWRKARGKATLRSCVVIIIFLIIWIVLKNSELSRLVDGESTSGREIGIRNAWNMFLQTDIFGKLFGNGYLYESQHTDTIGVHLVYLTFLVSTGIIGSILILLIFLFSMRRTKGEAAWSLVVFSFCKTLFEGLDYYVYIPLIISTIITNYIYVYHGNVDELFSKRVRKVMYYDKKQ